MIRDLARKIAEEKMLPVRAELDEKEEFPWEIVKISAEAGLLGVSMPEEYEASEEVSSSTVWSQRN